MAGIKKMHCLLMLSGVSWITSCASTDKLFAEYDDEFCPVQEQLVETRTIEKEVFRDRLVVKEIAAKGRTMPWDPAVYFDTDSADLSVVARQALGSNVDFLRQFPILRISIRGFTDQHSGDDYNRKLSVERISRVRRFYLRNGISGDRMVGHAHGESMAVSEDASVVNDEIGRRVEMVLLDAVGRPLVRHQPVVMGPAE